MKIKYMQKTFDLRPQAWKLNIRVFEILVLAVIQ